MSNGDHLRLSDPVLVSESEGIESIATLPLIDPSSGALVAQTKLHLNFEELRLAIGPKKTFVGPSGQRMLVSAYDAERISQIVGPGYFIGNFAGLENHVMSKERPCTDVFVYGENCVRLGKVHGVLEGIREGTSGAQVFEQANGDGGVETVNIAFSPVAVTMSKPLDPGNFSRGVEQERRVLLHVGVSQSEEGIAEGFAPVGNFVERTARRAIALLSTIIICTLVVVVLLSARVAMTTTVPLSQLLEQIKSVNR